MKAQLKDRVFIILPSNSPSGPIKGAFAMANGLVDTYKVTIVYLKSGNGVNAYLDPRIKEIILKNRFGFIGKVFRYRHLIKSNYINISVSMCFSADIANLFCNDITTIISSVRGNLPSNYYYDYGFIGIFLAYLHLNLLRNFDEVFAMSKSMMKQIKRITNIDSKLLGNFIDEQSLESFRFVKGNQPKKFNIVFIGSLSSRKQPLLLLDIFKQIPNHNLTLNFLGDGPLKKRLKSKINKLGLDQKVNIYGFVTSPYSIIAKSDILVLPSKSEGIARAVLEALYLGLKCIVFDIDANYELSKKCSKLFN